MRKLALLLLLTSGSLHAYDPTPKDPTPNASNLIRSSEQYEIERLEQRVEELEAQQAQDQQGTKTLSVMDN